MAQQCMGILIVSCIWLIAKASGTTLQGQDAKALQAFLREITLPSSSSSSVQGWVRDANPTCNWTGIQCNSDGRITALNLTGLGISGQIPAELSNCTALATLDLSGNHLSGSIPSSLGSLTNLQFLHLGFNNLSGTIPSTFGFLSNIQYLFLGQNYLTGSIPVSLSNCTKIVNLGLYKNILEGPIPPEFDQLTMIENISLYDNHLTGPIPTSMLVNCKRLTGMYLSYNYLSGSIPAEIGGLTELEQLWLNVNNLTGHIPEEIGNLSKLIIVDISHNGLTGQIPRSLGGLVNLSWALLLNGNLLTGGFPVELTRLINVQFLWLHDNMLTGPIPAEIGRMNKMTSLQLGSNFFTGQIPTELFNCTSIRSLLLEKNKLQGPIPSQIGALTTLTTLNLHGNHFENVIPESLGSCKSLLKIDLSSNALQGPIPTTLSNLTLLKSLDVSINKLSGEIPTFLAQMPTLVFLNLSNNDFQGAIPENGVFKNLTESSFLSNPHLCGRPLALKCESNPTSESKFIGQYLGVPFGFAALAFVAAILMMFEIRRRKKIGKGGHKNMVKFSLKDLNQATDNFNPANIIGKGRFSTVYKGHLYKGTSVAIKVVNQDSKDGAYLAAIFRSEIQAAANATHKNLARFIGYCAEENFRALVLPLMEQSLEGFLYKQESGLDWETLFSISKGVAEALAYLHHQLVEPVLHCDLKTGNILLDANMVPYVADFGLAKINNYSENGFTGYAPPDYGERFTEKGDVFSYGVLLLELITRTRPTDEKFQLGSSISKWVQDSNPIEIIDPLLAKNSSNNMNQICDLITIALACCSDNPLSRPTMKEIRNLLFDIEKSGNGKKSCFP